MKHFFKIFPFLAPVTLLLVALLLVSIWFKNGDFLATGEDGLLLYNPARTLKLFNSTWTEIGTGVSGSLYRPFLPLTFLELEAVKLHLSIFQFQKLMFFLLLTTGMISAYYLSRELLETEFEYNNLGPVSLIAALFYTFNPISLLGVWYRFISSFMFLYAAVPLFFLVFLKGLKTKKLKYIILLSLVTLPFCYGFASPAMVPLIWILPGIYILTTLFFQSTDKQTKRFIFVYSLVSLMIWILVNLWWIIPMKDYFTSFTSSSTANDLIYNVNTLTANSKDFTLDNTLRLIHGGFLYRNQAFGSIYNSVPFILLSWILPALSIIGLLKLQNKFLKRFLSVALVVSLFLAKGSAWPLGEIQILLFKIFPPMQLYRNSLEKWGLILPTIFMLAFAIGFVKLFIAYSSVKFRILLVVILTAYLFIFHWPLLTGAIIGYRDRKIDVEVPGSFEEVNKLLGDNHRLISLPMTGGASGKYTWKKPFEGHEISEYLFDSSVISKAFGGDSYSELFIKLSYDYNLSIITKAQLFASDMIVLRKDLNLKKLDLQDDVFKKSEEAITSSNLHLIADYPEFSVWEIPEAKKISMVSSFSSVIFINSIDSAVDLARENKIDLRNWVYVCDSKLCIPNVIVKNEKFENLINPEKVTFTKISPSDYKVKVVGNKGKFILTLFQSYHPDWRIKINQHDITDDNHFVADGLFNGFIIDEKGNNLDLEIKFVPDEKYRQLSKFYKNVTLFLVILLIFLFLKDSFPRLINHN